MGVVNFYHLTRFTTEDVVDSLLGRAVAQGWRVMIRSPDPAVLEREDARLWLHPEDGFLPHGLAGGPHDAEQPVLLGQGRAANGAQALLLLGPQEVAPGEVRAMERTWLLFEGADAGQVEAARAAWREVAAAGLAAAYWSDAAGKWEKKAETAGAGGE